ncbi:MAG: hypothetical protein JEZ07_12345 [Phycisphaerae bacterium]|nr:hypothetical protein [Phycisphaerae bacterium]
MSFISTQRHNETNVKQDARPTLLDVAGGGQMLTNSFQRDDSFKRVGRAISTCYYLLASWESYLMIYVKVLSRIYQGPASYTSASLFANTDKAN